MTTTCKYDKLRPDVQPCPAPPAFYVALTYVTGERCVNLCAGHDESVRSEFRADWRWSRPKRVSA